MAVDLFSSFDYLSGSGLGGHIIGLIFFFGGAFILILFHLTQFSGFKLSRGEMSAKSVAEGLFAYVYKGSEKSNVVRLSGSVGVFSSMFLCLVFFNIFGLVPGVYMITQDFYVGMVFSLTAWGAGVLLFWSPLWISLICHWVIPVANMVVCWLVSIVELVSVLVRSMTLVLRLGFNIIAGQAVFNLLSHGVQSGVQQGSGGKAMCFTFFFIFFALWEAFVGLFQAFMFVYLNLLYIEEVLFKH